MKKHILIVIAFILFSPLSWADFVLLKFVNKDFDHQKYSNVMLGFDLTFTDDNDKRVQKKVVLTCSGFHLQQEIKIDSHVFPCKNGEVLIPVMIKGTDISISEPKLIYSLVVGDGDGRNETITKSIKPEKTDAGEIGVAAIFTIAENQDYGDIEFSYALSPFSAEAQPLNFSAEKPNTDDAQIIIDKLDAFLGLLLDNPLRACANSKGDDDLDDILDQAIVEYSWYDMNVIKAASCHF